jgi:hypothetical protein
MKVSSSLIASVIGRGIGARYVPQAFGAIGGGELRHAPYRALITAVVEGVV